jgi:RHS repeat-associated protein
VEPKTYDLLHAYDAGAHFHDGFGCVFVSRSVSVPHKFTGKERDSESGLDEFGARYYASSAARFMTPDWAEKPIDVPYANFDNLQSLNLYSYVNSNPTATRDPDGHETQDTLDPQAVQEAGQTIGDVIVGSAKGLWNSVASLSKRGQRHFYQWASNSVHRT